MFEQLDGRPDIFFGDHVYVDRHREILKRAAAFEITAEAIRNGALSHTRHSQVPGYQATFTVRSLFRKLQYDVNLRICADHDFLLRAYEQGARFQYIDEIVASYAGGGFSASRYNLCRLEWNQVYRPFSDKPRAIDAFFFPDGSSPFLPFTARTGGRVSGFFPVKGPFPNLGIPA